jgi:hypothetical protein
MFIGTIRKGLATHSCFTDGRRVAIGMSGNKNSSDEERKAGNSRMQAQQAVNHQPCQIFRRSLTGITNGRGGNEHRPTRSSRIVSNLASTGTNPSPISPNPQSLCDERSRDRQIPTQWYVVNRGMGSGSLPTSQHLLYCCSSTPTVVFREL